MKIMALRVYQAALPLTEGSYSRSSDNPIESFDTTIFEVSIDEGFVGFGKRAYIAQPQYPLN
jgi:L-alanine-DL-glutamate epimerase-like enolase superfamily enzyme